MCVCVSPKINNKTSTTSYGNWVHQTTSKTYHYYVSKNNNLTVLLPSDIRNLKCKRIFTTRYNYYDGLDNNVPGGQISIKFNNELLHIDDLEIL